MEKPFSKYFVYLLPIKEIETSLLSRWPNMICSTICTLKFFYIVVTINPMQNFYCRKKAPRNSFLFHALRSCLRSKDVTDLPSQKPRQFYNKNTNPFLFEYQQTFMD